MTEWEVESYVLAVLVRSAAPVVGLEAITTSSRLKYVDILLLLICVSFTIIGQPRNSVLIRRVQPR